MALFYNDNDAFIQTKIEGHAGDWNELGDYHPWGNDKTHFASIERYINYMGDGRQIAQISLADSGDWDSVISITFENDKIDRGFMRGGMTRENEHHEYRVFMIEEQERGFIKHVGWETSDGKTYEHNDGFKTPNDAIAFMLQQPQFADGQLVGATPNWNKKKYVCVVEVPSGSINDSFFGGNI